MEQNKVYISSLKVGIIVLIFAFLTPLFSNYFNDSINDIEFGDFIFFWGMLFKDLRLKYYSNTPSLYLTLVFSILACIILNCFILRSIDRESYNNRKLAGKSFAINVIIILMTVNLFPFIEYLYVTNYSGEYFLAIPSIWWDYNPSFGWVGMFLGSFTIMFGSLYEMKRFESPYFVGSLLISLIALIAWIGINLYFLFYHFLLIFLLFLIICVLLYKQRRDYLREYSKV